MTRKIWLEHNAKLGSDQRLLYAVMKIAIIIDQDKIVLNRDNQRDREQRTLLKSISSQKE